MSTGTLEQEQQFLDQVYQTYKVCDSPIEAAMRGLLIKTFEPYLKGGDALELGCSDGLMTEMIAGRVTRLDVVDGSRKFLRKASQRQLGNVRFIHSLFEEFHPKKNTTTFLAATFWSTCLTQLPCCGLSNLF